MNNLVENLHRDVYSNIKKIMENSRNDVAKQEILSRIWNSTDTVC